MLKLAFTDEEVRTLNYERYHYPDPRVQVKMEVLWLKSQGLSHQEIARLAGVSTRTVQRYLNEYLEGGIERLKQVNYVSPQSALDEHAQTLREYFEEHPPATLKEAQDVIERLTGIRRSLTQVRAFLLRLGLRRLKAGPVPGKADDQKLKEQRLFVEEQLQPRLDEAEAGQRNFFLSMPAISFTARSWDTCGASHGSL